MSEGRPSSVSPVDSEDGYDEGHSSSEKRGLSGSSSSSTLRSLYPRLPDAEENPYVEMESGGVPSAPEPPWSPEVPPPRTASSKSAAAAVSVSSKSNPSTPTLLSRLKAKAKTPKSSGRKRKQLAGFSSRSRKHMLKESTNLARSRCTQCNSSIKCREAHLQCTQCSRRYHDSCSVAIPCDCKPPAFGGKSSSREAPKLGSNLQAVLDEDVASGTEEHAAFKTVPSLIEDCIATVDRRGLTARDIYVAEGDPTEVEKLVTKYLLIPAGAAAATKAGFRQRRPNLQLHVKIHEVAGALKHFLGRLDEPLSTFAEYASFMFIGRGHARKEEEQRQLCEILGRLPVTYLHSMRYVIDHLRRVLSKGSSNGTDAVALARVFAPLMFQSPQGVAGDERDGKLQAKIMKLLLDLPDEYWETSEKEALASGYVTSGSPVPEKLEAKRQKHGTKTLKSLEEA